MKDDEASDQRMFLAALKPGKDCPSVEQLDQLLDPATAAGSSIAEHVASCTYCQTELELLRQFQAGAVRENEAAAVSLITARLRDRSREMFRASDTHDEPRESWWRASWTALWHSPWFGRAALAASGIVLVVVLSLQFRNRPPALRPPSPDQEVLRSNAIEMITPVGDVAQAPNEIQWQLTPNAAKYEVQLLEVDGTELWKAEAASNRIEIPADIQSQIVPAKTLLLRVSAFDVSGHRIAQSEAVRFRLLQKVYKP
jgi:hypothetical protein